jgi:drug/metabolite transporter (DMT)-like permease
MTKRDSLELLLLSAIWGASFILIKLAGEVFPPSWVALLRLISGAAVLWIALWLRKKPLPPRRLLPSLLLIALLNNAVPFTLIAWGERTIPSNLAAVLNATTTLWSLLLAFLFGHDKLTPRMSAGVLLGFTGVALVVTVGQPKGEVQWWGIALVALGSISYAVATAMAKTRLKGFDPLGIATAQLSLGVLLMIPPALIGPWPSGITLQAVGAVSLLGIFGTGLAYLFYYGLLARLASVQVQAVTYILPVWGLFWGAMAGEAVGILSVVGVGVVLAGLVLLRGPAQNTSARR